MKEAFYKDIIDKSLNGFAYHKIICDDNSLPIDYEFIEVNSAFEKLTGLKSSAIIGKLASDIFPKIRNEKFDWINFFGNVAISSGEEEVEQYSQSLNKWFKVRVYSPRKYHFVTIFTKLPVYNNELEKIVDNPKYFEMVFDVNPDAVLSIRLNDGVIINSNSIFSKQLGYSREELIGKNCEKSKICADPLHYKEITDTLLHKGFLNNHEITFMRKDGSVFDALVSAKVVEITGSLFGFYNIHNIEIRKKMERALVDSETRYRRLFEAAKDGIIILDFETGKIVDVNPFLTNLLGLTKKQFLNRSIWELGSFKDIVANQGKFKELQREEYVRYEDMPLMTSEGEFVYVEFVSNVYLANGKKVIQCNIRDITERKLAKEALLKSEKKYRDYIENAPGGIFVVNEEGKYLEVNKAATLITGYGSEELLKMNIADITVKESLNETLALFSALKEKGFIIGALQFKHKSGSTRWWSINAVKLSQNRYLCFADDITEKKKNEDALVYFGYHDHLTGLYNRRFFEKELQRLDTDSNYPLSIIICDVNGLKLFNDSFGHSVGDELLKIVAEKITKACRPEDIICRIGGDEFSVILPYTDEKKALHIANDIKLFVSKEKVSNINLSISYGLDTKVTSAKLINEILANAENQMYRNKLYERSSMRNKTIDLIMNTLFEKSSREAAHSKRVGYICEIIASKMNFDEDSVNKMRIAGLIHDIGKISIDEKILNKPSYLNVDERKEIEKHTESGWRILSTSSEFVNLSQIVLDHHEKWDGTGYPNRLKGEQISLEARILSVADSYDAMTSKRSYKKALNKQEAIEELKRGSGTQFDPKIVDIFVNKILNNGYEF